MPNDNISYFKIFTVFAVSIMFLYFGVSALQFAKILPPSCTESDVYTKSNWSDCTKEGFMQRVVVKNKDISCLNPGRVTEPDSTDTCTYIPYCLESQIDIKPWSGCINGSQRRIVTVKENENCKINFNTIEIEKLCDSSEKNVRILENYTTQIDLSNSDSANTLNVYGLNSKNLKLQFTGKFSKIFLNILADTSYKIPEYYYFRFEIGKNSTQTIGTNRVASNRLNLSKKGIFKGTDTPVSKEFDLSNLEQASLDGEVSLESTFANYVKEINNRSTDILTGTLYIGDGRSMLEEDIKKRIFATILEAKLIYECENGSSCSIQNMNN